MKLDPHASKEDVLDAFAVEPEIDRPTLERYLIDFPEFAEDIVDLAGELTKENVEEPASLLADEQVLINSAWNRFATGLKAAANPFAKFSAAELRRIAETLGIRRSVLTAFRECSVIAATVPSRFLRRLSEVIGSEVEVVLAHLKSPPMMAAGRSYKSTTKPQAPEPVSFEQLLIDAAMSEGDRDKLLKED